MLSQIIVSVVAAVCVAFITNAYLTSGPETGATASAIPAAATESANAAIGSLPPLEVQEVADVPDGVVAGEEVFPGAPVGLRPEELQRAVSEANTVEEPKERRRRFLGIPIPFTSTADVAEGEVDGS